MSETLTLLFPSSDLYPGDDVFPGDASSIRVDPGSLSILAARAYASEDIAPLLNGTDSDQITAALLETSLAAAAPLGDLVYASAAGPWRAAIDPVEATPGFLPYAADVNGATLPGRKPGESLEAWEARARDAAIHPPARDAGSVGSIRAAARPFLRGTRSVKVVAGYGDEWHFEVRVRVDEVLDRDALLAAIDDDEVCPVGQKPVLTLVTPGSAWTIGELEDAYRGRTIADLERDFPSIAALEANPGGL